MADIPNQPPTTLVSEPETQNRNNIQHWCYNCNKRVSVETLANSPEIICRDCKLGFIELIPAIAFSSDDYDHNINNDIDPAFGSRFIQVLRLLAQSTRDDPAPPSPPRAPTRERSVDDGAYLRLELGGLEDIDDDDEEDDDGDGVEDDEDEDDEEGGENGRGGEGGNQTEYYIEDEEEELRRRRDVLRSRIRELATRARSGRRNRILDWAELLMGIEDNPLGEASDRYIGNPGDYVDAAGYEALLRELAESDGGGRKGAPPAAKSVVLELPKERVAAEEEIEVCAVCKDGVGFGEVVTKLPCGHGYHGDCIVPWLEARNTCPVCRFELPTDDADYEKERKKRVVGSSGGSSSSSFS